MSDAVIFNQDSMAGGEVMEVMMTGGDGSAMTDDTLAQVVNMLQMEGQLTAGGNHTIIIRQPGTDDIQMIQATSNDGEVVISKASAADIQTLQADVAMNNAASELIDPQQGQVMMVDETGNLVEGVMQLSEVEQSVSNSIELSHAETSNVITTTDSKVKHSTVDLLTDIVKTNGTHEYLVDSKSNSSAGSTISATGSIKPTTSAKISSTNKNAIIIKVDTKCILKVKETPYNALKILTTTGSHKYQAPKFHKCEACVINFVSKVAYMNHMESCTKQNKPHSMENAHYSCVFCNSKFNTRVVLMQHVQTCQKAKDSKAALSNSKSRLNTDNKLKNRLGFRPRITDNSKKVFNIRSNVQKDIGLKKSGMIFDLDDDIDNDLAENDLDSEDEEKGIVYDDDEDINDEDFDDDNIDESMVNRKSQKHLGPVILNGLFKCRDCNRTFTKEHQYNRHVRACTMAPLISSRIDNSLSEVQNTNEDIHDLPSSLILGKKKRGRPSKSFMDDEKSPKKINLGPKIVSIDPKKVVAASLQGKFLSASENEFLSQTTKNISGLLDDGRKKASKFAMKGKQNLLGISTNNISKIVKVSPSDNLIKKSGKALLSKISQQKAVRALRDNPICGLCGDKFKSNEDLAVHIQINHSDDLLNLRDLLDGKRNICATKCPMCELHFNANSLMFHIITFHADDLQLAQDELDDLNLNLLCPYCNSISLSQDLLREHLATKHFERLVNRPTPSVSPVAIDINKLLKERINSTNMPVAKQEKVLCPDCNLFISSSFYSHHKCTAEMLSPSEKKFVCSEDACVDITFFKLDHLLSHFSQAHIDIVESVEKSFEMLSEFLEWLKEEETKTKMKYTKSFQRLNKGKLCCVWICYHFHNAMRDSSLLEENLSRSSLCYSRIHVETSFSISTARYDGKTCIKYFSTHVHPSAKPIQEVKVQKKKNISDNLSLLKEADKVAFSNTDELKSLLEDTSSTNDVTLEEQPVIPQDEISKMDLEPMAADIHTNDVEMTDQPKSNDTKIFQENTGMKDLKADTLVSMPDPDEFLLEKMLREHDSNTQVPDNFLEDSTKMEEPAPESNSLSNPSLCLIPAVDKMPSEVLDALDVNDDEEKSQNELKKMAETLPMEVDKEEDKDSEMEESTYVLPADLDEWRKLFELVRNSLTVSKLPSDELLEAKKVLNLAANIAEEPVEKQIEVFTKLCSLADVHL